MRGTPNGSPKGYRSLDNTTDNDKEAVSIEELLDRVGFGWRHAKVLLLGCSVYLADGMEIMVLSILGPTLQYEWNISPLQQAFLTTSVFIGLFVGAPFFGYIADTYGRLKSLAFSSAWTFGYAMLSAAAPTYEWMLLLRMLLGVGIGGGVQMIPYVAEFLPSRYRGKVISLCLGNFALGSVLNISAALLFMQYGWRYWILCSALPALIAICLSLISPESPRFELACGRREEALRSIRDLSSKGYLPDVQLKQIDIKKKGRLADLFVPQLRKTTILIAVSWFNVGFMYYGFILVSTELIKKGDTCATGLDYTVFSPATCHLNNTPLTDNNLVSLFWTAIGELPSVVLDIIVIDTLGRRRGLLCESAMYCTLCVLLNICMGKGWMMVLLVVNRFICASIYHITTIYTNELYPTEVRSLAVGLGNGLSRIGAMLTPYIAQILLHWSLHLGLTVYAMWGFLNTIIIFFIPIETKGREMADNFAKSEWTPSEQEKSR